MARARESIVGNSEDDQLPSYPRDTPPVGDAEGEVPERSAANHSPPRLQTPQICTTSDSTPHQQTISDASNGQNNISEESHPSTDPPPSSVPPTEAPHTSQPSTEPTVNQLPRPPSYSTAIAGPTYPEPPPQYHIVRQLLIQQQQSSNVFSVSVEDPSQGTNVFAVRFQDSQQGTNVFTISVEDSALEIVDRNKDSDISFRNAIILACLTFLLCGVIFGLVAFIFAIIGQISAARGEDKGARQLRRASYGVSTVGIIVALVVVIVVTTYPRMLNSCYPPTACTYGYFLNSFNCKTCCFVVPTNSCGIYGTYSLGSEKCCSLM